MPAENAALATFNRGLVDPRALGRVDLKRVAMAAETQTNWIPRSMGSMSLRPGLKYIGETRNSLKAKNIPFIFSSTDTAIIEITSEGARVLVSEAAVSRTGVSSAVTSGLFTSSDISAWTDADETGSSSYWVSGGYLGLVGTKYNAAIRRQAVTVAATDQSVKHALNIGVERSTVALKVGSSAGADNYIAETSLAAGYHSLSFTPTGNFTIELANRSEYAAYVDSVAVASSGDMLLTTPWASSDLPYLRWSESADVVFVACEGYQQRKFERRATESWSLVKYEAEDGPFRDPNVSATTIAAGARTGDTTLTASQAYFSSNNVGSLMKLESIGQTVGRALNGATQWSDSIVVTGSSTTARRFAVEILGTFTASVTLQRSNGDDTSFSDAAVYSSTTSVNYDDVLDNQIIYYRIGIDAGDYTSGTATATLTYSGGSKTGIARITGYTSATVVDVAVLKAMGNTAATPDWAEGIWSTRRGFPTAVEFYEGRLWWAGNDRIIGSVSDAFGSFDEETTGDSGPINRTLASGPVDVINWLLPMQRLIVGTQGAEVSCRSDAFDEPLTPTNFNLKDASTQGSANVIAVKVDTRGVFVQKSGLRVYELKYDFAAGDYSADDLTVLVPGLGDPGFSHIAVQRQPDTRIHCVRSDGRVAMLVYLPAEDVRCWLDIDVGGVVEDAFVLPGTNEDAVYYCVKRTIQGADRRYLEKWAMESECIGETLNRQADSFVEFTNSPASTTVSGLSHLNGRDVIVWQDGVCPTSSGAIATYTVSSGSITLATAASKGIVGLPYWAEFQSAKLPYGVGLGSVIGQKQRISKISLLLSNTHSLGIRYGGDFNDMNTLPLVLDGVAVNTDEIHVFKEIEAITFPAESKVDSRLCLEAVAPRPATVAAAVIGIVTHDTAP